jgi:hypothetical protein
MTTLWNASARDLRRNGVVIEEMGMRRRDSSPATASAPVSVRRASLHLAERFLNSLSFLNPADAGPTSR